MSEGKISWILVGLAAGILNGSIIGALMFSVPTGRPWTELEVGTRYENQDLPPNLLFLRKVAPSESLIRLYRIDGVRRDTLPKEFVVTRELKNGQFEIIPYKPIKLVAKRDKKTYP